MVPDVPGTDATRLLEVRGEEVVDDGLVFGGRRRRGRGGGGGCGGRVVGGPRQRRGGPVSAAQKRQQQQPDGDGRGRRPLFTHFRRYSSALVTLFFFPRSSFLERR